MTEMRNMSRTYRVQTNDSQHTTTLPCFSKQSTGYDFLEYMLKAGGGYVLGRARVGGAWTEEGAGRVGSRILREQGCFTIVTNLRMT